MREGHVLSVVIATRNRVSSLRSTLESVTTVRPPADGWEVVVVDNASTDGTRDLVSAYAMTSPVAIRVVVEPRIGKSWAVNTGIREARGDIIAFTDDDVRVDGDWAQGLVTALAAPEYAGVGGRIVADCEGAAPPPWMTVHGPGQLMHVGGFDVGPPTVPLRVPPFGANMAFRRDVFERHGLFRTDLGPGPGRYLPGQDTEFGWRLLRAGERLAWAPAAVIRHRVRPDAMTQRYVTSWYFAHGRMSIRTGRLAVGDRRVCGVPSRLIARLGRTALGWFVCVEPRRRFRLRAEAWRQAGAIVEAFAEWRAQRGAL